MKAQDIAQELKDIKSLLKEQGRAIKEIQGGHAALPKKHHWRMMIALATLVLFVGSYACYEYYLVLQSIIDQYPHNGVSRVK